jgi:hypothetical protein
MTLFLAAVGVLLFAFHLVPLWVLMVFAAPFIVSFAFGMVVIACAFIGAILSQ